MFAFMGRALANPYHESENPDGIISLGIAENMLMSSEMAEFLSKNLKITTNLFGYGASSPGLPSLIRGILNLYNSEPFKPVVPVTKNHIYPSSGCTTLLDQLSWTLCDEGDGVLIGRPCYGGFAPDMTGRSKLTPVFVSLKGIDPFSLDAVRRYEEELLIAQTNGIRVRLLVLSNPHNPLGQYYY
jgi:1-aminocyclopropane-1-carboxylate synthase